MRAVDQSARDTAIDPTKSFCVSAPAGSGKTELLTQRLLALLARVERPEQVLAITFTRKAASEMSMRLLEKLEQARMGATVTAEHERHTRQLAKALLAHAEQRQWRLDQTTLNIRTIDSLCHELTRQMPILSGLGGLVEAADNAQPLYEEAVREFLSQAGEGDVGRRIIQLLAHFDNRWSKVSELLVAMLGRRGDWGQLIQKGQDPSAAEATILATMRDLSGHRIANIAHHLSADLDALLDAVNQAREHLEEPPLTLTADVESLADWQAMVRWLLTSQFEWRKPGGVNAKLGFPPKSPHKAAFVSVLESISGNEALREALIELVHLPQLHGDIGAWERVVLVASLLPVLQAHLLLVFQRSGAVDHTHIALAAIQALGSDEFPTQLAQRLDYQLEHILVDEFQDTSASQAELLRRLMRGWEEHNATGAAPRTVFVVGDAMQSIYGFRYADVSLFLNAMRGQLAGVSLEPLTLTQNFRSRPEVVGWVNDRFSSLFASEDDPGFGRVKHVQADAIPVESDSEDAGVRLAIIQAESDEVEAHYIAQEIALLRRRYPSQTVAVLVRAKTHASFIGDALTELNIPYTSDAIQSLLHEPVVTDLMSVCRWLANPADMVAALALLTGPWCGIALSSISLLLAEHDERPLELMSALEKPPANINTEDLARLHHLREALSWAETKRDRLSLPVWIEQIWLRLGGAYTARTRDMRCVEAFLSALRRAEQIGAGLDIGWLERELGGMAMESPGDVDAVRIMTLHKAKGLEFDTVLMPYLHKRTRGLQGDLIRWHWHHKTQPPGLLIAANDEIKTSDSLYNYLSFLQKKKDREELKRLLYVGITRAKCQCILSGTLEWEGDNPPPKPPAGSLLEVLLEGAGVNKTKVITNADLIPVETPLLSDTMAGAEGRGRLAQARLRSGEYAPELSTGRQLAEPLHADEHRTERLIGTITHRVLELLASAETLPMPDDPQIAVWIERNTQRLVLRPDRTQIICQRVQWLVAQTLSCDIGQWILSSHPDSGVEMSLSCIEESEVKRYVIDRTFLNVSDGIRWVIDYKTGEPAAGEDLSAFEARQTELYQGQLHQYAHLLERYFASSEAPIKTALYFPATQRLVECS